MTDTTPNNPSTPAATPQIPLLSSIEDFVFGAPLYAEYDIASVKEGYFNMFCAPLAIDGHCPYCHKSATFRRTIGELKFGQLEFIKNQSALYVQISCTRNEDHQIDFVFRLKEPLI